MQRVCNDYNVNRMNGSLEIILNSFFGAIESDRLAAKKAIRHEIPMYEINDMKRANSYGPWVKNHLPDW
jgi:hypothetical protein